MGFRVEIQYNTTHHTSGAYSEHFQDVAKELWGQFSCDVKTSSNVTVGAFEIILVQDAPPSTDLVFSKLGCGRWPSPSVICDVIRDFMRGQPVPASMTSRQRPRTLDRMNQNFGQPDYCESFACYAPSPKTCRLNQQSKMHLAEKKLRPLSPIHHAKTTPTPVYSCRRPQDKPDCFSLSPRKTPNMAQKPSRAEIYAGTSPRKRMDWIKAQPNKPAKSSSQRPVCKAKVAPKPSRNSVPPKCPVEEDAMFHSVTVGPADSAAGPAKSSPADPIIVNQPAIAIHQNPVHVAKSSSAMAVPQASNATSCIIHPPVSEKTLARVELGGAGEFEVQIGRGCSRPAGDEDRVNKIVLTPCGGLESVDYIGKSLCAGSTAKKTRIKKCEHVKILDFDDDVLDLAVHSRLVACVGESANLTVWDFVSRQKMFAYPVQSQILAVAFSSSGTHLAIADSMGELLLFSADENSFKLLAEYHNEVADAEDSAILCIAFSPCGGLLTIGDMEAKVTILTVPKLTALAELMQADDVHSVTFSNCGTYIASGSGGDRHHGLYTNKTATSDMRVVVWKVTSAREFRYIGQCLFEDVIYATKFSPDSKWLAVGTDDACVSLLSVENNFLKLIELAASAGIRCLDWSPDSRFLAIGGVAKTVDVWDLAVKQLTFSFPMAEDWITAIAFAPDMQHIIMSSFDEPVRVYTLEWENLEFVVASAKKMKSYKEIIDAKFQKFQRVDLGNAEDAEFTVVVANEQCMRRPSLLQAPPGALVVGTPQKLESISLSVIKPCGNSADAKKHLRASIIELNKVVRLRVDDFPDIESEPETISCADETQALSLSRDGKLLACGGWDETLTVINTDSREVVWRRNRSGPVTCIAWSTCQTYVACGSEDGFIGLWNAAGDELGQVENFAAHDMDMHIGCIQFSPTGKLLAWGDMDKKVTLVSIPDLEQVAELVHDGDLKSLSFSATGSMLAGGGGTDRQHGLMDTKSDSAQMKTMVWSRSIEDKTWKTLARIISPNVVTCVAFSPDEQFLAIGDDGTKFNILIPHQSFKKFIELELPASVTCLAWSPCSCFVLVGSASRDISVFHVHSHTLIKTIPGFNDWMSCITFAPTYKLFAVAAHDEKVYIFRLKDYKKPGAPNRIETHESNGSGFSISEEVYSSDYEKVETDMDDSAKTPTQVQDERQDSDYDSDPFENVESDEC